MSNVRNWASCLLLAALILLAPVIGFAVIVAAEMLTDLLAKLGAPWFGRSPPPLWGWFCCASTVGSLGHLSCDRKGCNQNWLLRLDHYGGGAGAPGGNAGVSRLGGPSKRPPQARSA